MFVRDLILSSLKRWYFLLLGLIVSGVATFLVFGMISPTYEANASMVLIPPKVAVTVGENPYLYLGGLDQALGVLQVKVASPSESASLTDKFPGAELSIAKDATTSGPIIAIKVSSDDADDTMELLAESISLVPKTLGALQKELQVPKPSLITVMELSSDHEPTKVAKKQLQMTMIVAAGGASLSLLGTGFLDRLINRRKAKKEAKSAEAETFTRLSPVGDENIGKIEIKNVDGKRKRSLRVPHGLNDRGESDPPAADVGT